MIRRIANRTIENNPAKPSKNRGKIYMMVKLSVSKKKSKTSMKAVREIIQKPSIIKKNK